MPSRLDLPTLQHSIRQRTAAAHAALEQTPLMLAFADDVLSLASYRSYLSLQWRLHAPLESALAVWVPQDWLALRLCKCAWLEQDLRALGAEPDAMMTNLDPIESWAEALGTLYVLEGSTLGLQVVRKQLQGRHPALQVAGRFMLGYGPETGHHWREFLACLESLDEQDWPLAQAAACRTFDYFLEGFSGVGLQPA